MTLDHCAEAYINAHETGRKNDTLAAQRRSTLKTYVAPLFGQLPVQSIDTTPVMKVFEAQRTDIEPIIGSGRSRPIVSMCSTTAAH